MGIFLFRNNRYLNMRASGCLHRLPLEVGEGKSVGVMIAPKLNREVGRIEYENKEKYLR